MFTAAGERVATLTGLVVDEQVWSGVLAGYGIDFWDTSFTEQGVLRAAADLLIRAATSAASGPQVRQVEDVSVEPVKVGDLLTLAAHFRARADGLDDDAAGVAGVVEFNPYGSVTGSAWGVL